MESMKILIITVTAGEGHNSISKAIMNKLKQNNQNDIKLVDLYKDYGSTFEQKMVNDGYLLACKLTPNFYNIIYKQLQALNPENRDNSIVQSSIRKQTPRILNCIYEFKPDVIVMTHFYPSIIITNLKKYYPIDAKTITILTDYCVHPFWESAIGIDYMITPSNQLHSKLINKGFKENQLISFGLPVKEEFSHILDKTEVKKELNLDINMPTILIMQGGGGMGGVIKILNNVLKCKTPLQILCVNGHDKKSKNQIDNIIKKNKFGKHKIINYGFIDFVAKAMSACDIIIGKCGCISVNETLNKEKPLIICAKLVEQEKSNMEYLVKNKSAIYINNPKLLPNKIDNLLQGDLDNIVQNIRKIKKPNALNDLCNFIQSFDKVNYDNIQMLSDVELKQVNKNIRKAIKKG